MMPRSPRSRSRARRPRRRAAASVRAPSTTCEKMSLPWSVVPKRWCHEGACRASSRLKSFGSCDRDQRRDQRDRRSSNGDHDEPDARLRVARAGARASRGCGAGGGARRPAAPRAGRSPGRRRDGLELRHQAVRTRGSRTRLRMSMMQFATITQTREHEQQRLRRAGSRCRAPPAAASSRRPGS